MFHSHKPFKTLPHTIMEWLTRVLGSITWVVFTSPGLLVDYYGLIKQNLNLSCCCWSCTCTLTSHIDRNGHGDCCYWAKGREVVEGVSIRYLQPHTPRQYWDHQSLPIIQYATELWLTSTYNYTCCVSINSTVLIMHYPTCPKN